MPIKKDIQLKASDGDTYLFLGSQWRNIKNGKIAGASIAMELESLAISNNMIYGDSVFEDLLNRAIEKGLMPARGKLATEWILERNKESREWTRDQSRRINKSGASLRGDMFADANIKKVSDTEIGKMYMYLYDAKHKKTLKYWDFAPVIFCIEKYSGNSAGHLGINLHYLPYLYRAKLMDALYKIKTTRYMNESTRLNVSYQVLKQSSKFKGFKPCLHRYLKSSEYTKTDLLEIPPNYWSYVAFLPMQRFMKASTQTVWRDSIQNM